MVADTPGLGSKSGVDCITVEESFLVLEETNSYLTIGSAVTVFIL